MKIKVIQPEYYKDFKCIGSECRHNCCTGNWEIHVDKNTYKKYRNLSKNHPFYNELKDNLKIYDKDSFHKYAEFVRVKKNETGKQGCIFQTKEGWCKIQAQLGEDYLGYTCKTYPRVLNIAIFKDIEREFFERSCNISCEEIANIFINKKDYLEYELFEEEYGKNYIIENMMVHLNNAVNENKRKIIKYYSEIKSIIIAILQNREYDFEDRLILMALFCDKLNKFEQTDNIEEIPNYIEEFVLAVDNRLYDEILKIKARNEVSYAFSFVMLEVFLEKNNLKDKEYVFNKLYENIQKLNIETVDDYKNSILVKNYKTFLKEKEIFLEHVFVNELFTRMMPFYKDYNIFENAQILISLYVLYRLIISGFLGEREHISDEEIVDITAYFGKLMLHSNMIVNMLMNTIKETEMDSLSNMILLIKG